MGGHQRQRQRHLEETGPSTNINNISGSSSSAITTSNSHNRHGWQQTWVRGVNLGGWLLMERYITPYQFALTTCHVEGEFCWYPGQINAPPNAKPCAAAPHCKPLLRPNVFGQLDYPLDEHALWKAFGKNTGAAEEWLRYHLEYFITEKDIEQVRASGATHVRLPLPHWILQSSPSNLTTTTTTTTTAGEHNVWIVGARWQAFQRLVKWARKYGLHVWPDIHTAPGSQNGFDNSGQQLSTVTCQGWSDHADRVAQSLEVLQQITQRIADEAMLDVVTGLGLLNEPFGDCDRTVYMNYLEQGLDIVRTTMGVHTHVYVGDLFGPGKLNDGKWWLDPARYNNTYLDSHHYHVFAETMRALSPRQHIALTCQDEYHVETDPYTIPGGVASCCWNDPPINTIPSQGIRRMIGEWSVAVDTLPSDMLYVMLQAVAHTGTVLHLNRTISPQRQEFLRNFAQAQMVIYEMQDQYGLGAAWFYWTVKMEGGAFAEWDYLRGIQEGWLPRIPPPTVSSQSLHGSCYEIMARTTDNRSIIDEFPAPQDLTPGQWRGQALDDDVIVSHGDSILHPAQWSSHHHESQQQESSSSSSSNLLPTWMRHHHYWAASSGILFVVLLALTACIRRRPNLFWRRKMGYTELPQALPSAE